MIFKGHKKNAQSTPRRTQNGVFGIKMMVKSGLEILILITEFAFFCKNLPSHDRSKENWSPPWDFIIIFSRSLFTIIFRPRVDSILSKEVRVRFLKKTDMNLFNFEAKNVVYCVLNNNRLIVIVKHST